jgi:hypothetical protein
MLRAVNGPVTRAAFGLLYINNYFYGLTIVVEDVDEDFIARRFEDDDGQGTLFKMYLAVHLQYDGSDYSYYYNQHKTTATGNALYFYNPEVNTTTAWQEMIDLLYYFNQTQGKNFEDSIQTYVDMDSLLRFMVVECFFMNYDTFNAGNNFYLYHRRNDPNQKLWSIWYYDYEDSFNFNPYSSNNPTQEPDILKFFSVHTNREGDWELYNPVLDQIFSSKQFTDQYIDYFETFMDGLYGSDTKQYPQERYSRLANFISPWVAKDRMWQMSNGMAIEQYYEMVSQTIQHLNWRYQDVFQQIENYKNQSAF